MPGSRVSSRASSMAGSDTSDTDEFPGREHSFSGGSGGRMARSLQRLQAKVKRTTNGSDTDPDIDGSSFTGNPFADVPPMGLPAVVRAMVLPTVVSADTSPRADKRPLQKVRVATPEPLSVQPRSASVGDMRPSFALSNADLAPYHRTSSKPSLQGTLQRMQPQTSASSNVLSRALGQLQAAEGAKATLRVDESTTALPIARGQETGVKARPGELLRAQRAGVTPQLNPEEQQMARLEALAREAAGPGVREDTWDAVSLFPPIPYSGRNVELSSVRPLKGTLEDDVRREAALDRELGGLSGRATSPRGGNPGTWGRQGDAGSRHSEAGVEHGIIKSPEKKSGGIMGKKQVSFGDHAGMVSLKASAAGSGRHAILDDIIRIPARHQYESPGLLTGRASWLPKWFPTSWKGRGAKAGERVSLRDGSPYSDESSPTFANRTDSSAGAAPRISAGLQNGSAYMHKYLATLREKMAAVTDVEAAQSAQVQPDETPRCRGFAATMCCLMTLVILCAIVELWFRNPAVLHLPPHRVPPPPPLRMSQPPPMLLLT